jgi:hypothetical protein
MKVLRFKNDQPEWDTPLPELAPEIKCALKKQWREFIQEVEAAENPDDQPLSDIVTSVAMFERCYKEI